MLNSREIDCPVENVLHLGAELFEYGRDISPDDLGLLACVSFGTSNELTSRPISSPLCRYVGKARVGRDNGHAVIEIVVRGRAGLSVEVFGGRHLGLR